MSNDYLPRPDGEFDGWFKNLVQYVTQKTSGNPPAWSHIPPGEVAALGGVLPPWEEAFGPTQRPHGPVETAAKNAARAAAEAVIRPFKRRFLDDPPVTDEDRVAMAIPVRDSTRTPSPAPVSYPEAEADSSVIRQLSIHFRDNATGKRAKPHGVHGAEIRWALMEEAPAGVDGLFHSDFDTASPFTLSFEEADRGRRVYYCLRWESTTNLKGPWGEIYSAIIP